jgi:lysophospholipase L1-like esterase
MFRLLLAGLLSVYIGAVPFQDPPYEGDIKKFEAQDAKNPPAKGGIVLIGSSSVLRWTTLKEDFPSYNFIQRGFGGSQISDSIRYAHRIVTPYEPKMVILYAGTNDIASGKSGEQVFADYKTFIAKVREKLPKATVAYISMSPAPSRAAKHPEMAKANSLIQGYTQKGKNLKFVNTFPKMLDKDGKPRIELFVEDLLHLSPAGYAIVKEEVRKVLPK